MADNRADVLVKDKPFLLFVLYVAMLLAAYNVFWFIKDEALANKVSWAILNSSFLMLPLSLYLIGEELKKAYWRYAASIMASFAIGNMADFLIGNAYVLHLSEYVFAFFSVTLITYEYFKSKWKN